MAKRTAEPPAPAGPELRVVAVEAKDVLGARQLRMEPGRLTLIEGRNGSGKSTALQVVQAALGRGSLAKIARVDERGEEVEPEVCLVLEGPGEHLRVKRGSDELQVRRRVGDTAALEDVNRPQEFVAGLFDAECSNPVAFLTAPDKDRALMLLEALPLKFDRARLLAEMSVTAEELLAMGSVPTGLHPLEEIALIREAVFRARTGVNRDEKQQRASAEQLRRNIPATIPDNPAAAIADLQAATETLAAGIARDDEAAAAAYEKSCAAAKAAFDIEEEKVRGSFQTDAAKLRADAERRIAEIRAEVEREVQKLREGGEAVLSEEEDRKDAAIAAADKQLDQARVVLEGRKRELAGKREELATLRARAETSTRARALADQVDQFDHQADQLRGESERLTKALEALDAHRRRLAESLPISGLEIQDREVRVNGIKFEQLNTAQRVDIAVQVATLRAKGHRLPVLFVDGAEALDREHFEHLCRALKESGVQAFVARVSEGPLRVVTEEAHAAVS